MLHAHRRLTMLAWSALFGMTSLFAPAQTTSPMTRVGLDAAIAIPTTTDVLGQQDGAALKEIMAHLTAVGLAPWVGMQGTGQIVYGPSDTTAYAATLSMMGRDRFRLDANTEKGKTSLRINGQLGKIQGNSGLVSTMPSETAALGIFPFGLVRLTDFLGQENSLFDRGLINEDGIELHRMTVEIGTTGWDALTKSRSTSVIDFYFDPATHLLTKSATLSSIANGRSPNFLRVVSYSDYRKVGTSMVPFRLSESMEGQQLWVLQLSDVRLNPTLDATYFQF